MYNGGMRHPRWLKVALARKLSLLFGAAVLLTIAATLVFPWLQMNALHEQATLLKAKRVATAAVQAVDVYAPDWVTLQEQLQARWMQLASDLALPPEAPRLVSVDSAHLSPFQREAIHRLRRDPDQRYYWRTQDDGQVFRFVMAVRGAPADPHPQVLRGIVDVRLPTAQDAVAWNWAVTLLAGASGAVLAILVFYMLTQRLVLSPVHALRRVAEKVTTGDMTARSSIQTGDEYEDLSEALNDMLTHLRAAQQEQQKINRSLDVRVGELAEINVALHESNRIKSEFLANVTHELRTPLVSIIGFAELLRDAWENPEVDRTRLSRYSQNILSSARSLLDLINDLLDLAKIEAGKMGLHVSEFSLAELGRDMIDFVRPLADKRNQQLALRITNGLPTCRSDSGKVKQILYNLLSNAIKFTPTGGSVGLVIEPGTNGWVRLLVTDTGPGIPPERQGNIFEKFRQMDSSETREHEGTGLGLAITKELAHRLGGEIHVASSEGHGSTFGVDLPARVEEPLVTATPGPP